MNNPDSKSPLTSQAKDFPRWYQDIIAKAELADNGPVRGTMVIRPYGYSIWEVMQQEVDTRIKATGTQNAYFPIFIPSEYLKKEAKHLEGFSPEVAVVTHGGGKDLAEPVVVRPTSETIINAFFAKWINSHRDLPLKVNQWANVVRWELRPRIFLRTTEFLWQEGHTAHVTEVEARNFALKILTDVYKDFMENILAIPVYTGLKTNMEKFPGSMASLSCEAMMKDGKALQMGTSHTLGQNFSKMFDIKYLDKEGEHFVWQTSWGVSTRMMGGLIMSHGDDFGLCLPPRLAPIQAVVMVVRNEPSVAEMAAKICTELQAAGIKAVLDEDEDSSFGRRTTGWELKGVPLRIEVGPRDLKEGTAVLTARDKVGLDGAKSSVALEVLTETCLKELSDMQGRLFGNAQKFMSDRTHTVDSTKEAVEAAASGFAIMNWADLGENGEKALLEKGVTVRCIIRPDGQPPDSLDEQDLLAVAAKAY